MLPRQLTSLALATLVSGALFVNASPSVSSYTEDREQWAMPLLGGWSALIGDVLVELEDSDDLDLVIPATDGGVVVTRPLPAHEFGGSLAYQFRLKGASENGTLVEVSGALLSFILVDQKVEVHVFDGKSGLNGGWHDTGYRSDATWAEVTVLHEGDCWSLWINETMCAEGIGFWSEGSTSHECVVYGNEDVDLFLSQFKIDADWNSRSSDLYFSGKDSGF